MITLGIESSCDETAVAIVRDGHEVLANVISSQIATHSPYGGVIPELAAREHLLNIRPTLDAALAAAGLSLDQVDGFAVTNRPGLLPALLVGVSLANGLACALGKVAIGVHHLAAHVYAGLIERQDVLRSPQRFPLLALLVSGGHSDLILIQADGTCAILGRTLDDAAGEAFDKGAKILNLPYPGGPLIDRLAQEGDAKAYEFPRALLPGSRSHTQENHLSFSFSGLKTSLLTAVKQLSYADAAQIPRPVLADLCASYQEAIVDVLAQKTKLALQETQARTLLLCGGVACNSALRQRLRQDAELMPGLELILTPPKYCTDNAAMIAGLGYHLLRRRQPQDAPWTEASPQAEMILQLPFLQH